MRTDEPRTIRLEDYTPPAYLINAVDLDFDLGAETTRVKSALTLRANHDRTAAVQPLVLNGEALTLLAIALDGRALAADEYTVTADSLTLHSPLESFRLDIETEIHPAANTRLEGLYVSKGTFCTQCEAEGFRRITWFLDRPDVMATYRTTIRADRAACPVLLSNGNLVEQGELPEGRHYAVWHDPYPKPCYLFALVAGNLACVEQPFTTASGRPVRLRIFVEHGNEDRCGYAMDALKRAMRWDEQVFGLEYDLDLFNIVAVGDFNMGAMENKSLNIFNSKYVLANPETATDQDYSFIEAIVAHEYFHNWTGNRVTCRDWFQLSLKEGLTVFRDQEFTSDQRSRPVKRIQTVRQLRARQFPEDAGPLAHPVRPAAYQEINNFYTATVYEKGAEVIRMMHTLLGPERFRRGMDLYFARHDGQAVTCDDFAAAMQDAGGIDLAQFKLWYSQAGTPEVTATADYDPAARTYTLDLAQSCPPTPGQPEKRPMHIPLAVGLLDRAGRDLPLRLEGETAEAAAPTRILQLREPRQRFRLTDVPEPPVPSLNRGFSSPVTLEAPLGDADRAFLMGHDSDPFNRWEAGQQYATRLLLDMIAALQRGEPAQIDDAFIAALGRTLRDPGLDRAFVALALTLPLEGYLAEQMAVVDVEAIHAARETLRRAVAARLKEDFLAAHHGSRSNRPYAPDPAQAGLRAVKNTALAYLAALHGTAEGEGVLDLVAGQYRAADNMTDRMAALGLLADIDHPVRAEALDDFYQRFHTEPNVVDKWLSTQAMSALPDTLTTVRALLDHPAFSIRNPNKVFALIGSFASGNQVRFHAADGSGYAFLADQVLALDRLNPHTAARLLQPLGRWRRFDEGRQALMGAALERILQAPELSPDVHEIASKSLA